jgi:TldD protein
MLETMVLTLLCYNSRDPISGTLNLGVLRQGGLLMFRFPKNLYTDVRIETVSVTNITLENLELKQNKVKKDQGAFIRIFDGKRWYYCATTELTNLQREIDNLARLASPNPEILNHPLLKNLEVNREVNLKYENSDLSEIENKAKVELLNTYLPIIKAEDQVRMSRMYYLDKHVLKQFFSSRGSEITFDSQNCCLAIRYLFQINNVPYQGSEDVFALDFAGLAGQEGKIIETMNKDLEYCKQAVNVVPGTYTCILSPLTTGVFAHERFGHKSEADFMVGDETLKKEWNLGKKVGAEILNIVDTGLIEGSGYVPFDDEGNRAKKNFLIKDGLLNARLHNASTATNLAEAPTGNARALNFEYEPIVRMTTTYIEKGDQTKEELFADIEEGIFIDNLNHGSGMTTFTIAPRRAYMIRKGEIAEPVRISCLTGNVMNTLHEIDGISDQVELFSFALGGCGKMEQYPLPVAFGGPYIRVRALQVL